MEFLKLFISPTFYQTFINLSIPLILATLAAVISNKVGILNISIEGTMTISAMTAAIFSTLTNLAFMGVLMGAVVGAVFGVLFYFFTVKMKANHILVGIAFNIICLALSVLVIFFVGGSKSEYQAVPLWRFSVPGISKIPFLGAAFFTDINLMIPITIVVVIGIYILLKKTVLGLRIKSVGLNDTATQTVGVKTNRVKMIALAIAGALAGLAGAYMSQGYMSGFNPGMVAGRGFIGVAAEAIGSGHAVISSLFALLFGLVDAVAIQSQTIPRFPIKPELINALPYLITLMGLIIYSAIKKYNKKKRKLKKEKKEVTNIESMEN